MDTDYEEDYFGLCAKIYMTVKCNIVIHCTLCENKYKWFEDYQKHLIEKHFPPTDEDSTENIQTNDSLLSSNSGKNYSTENKEFIFICEPIVDPIEIEEKSNFEIGADAEILTESQEEELRSVEPPKLSKNNSSVNGIRAQLCSRKIKTTITDRKYECPYCAYTGSNRTNMNHHIQRHSLNKPHKCTECSKAFYTRTELQTHVRTHTGERPYLCTLCGKAFSTSSMVNSHQKRHNNIRDKECPICKMRFFGTKYLTRHMAVHSDVRAYKCQQCVATFKSDLALKTHIKLHENKREYHCQLCESRFNQRAGLYSHMKTSHAIIFNTSKDQKLQLK